MKVINQLIMHNITFESKKKKKRTITQVRKENIVCMVLEMVLSIYLYIDYKIMLGSTPPLHGGSVDL